MTAYLRHRVHPANRWGTACGASWQGWQAPPGLTLSSAAILAPYGDPMPGDEVRTCAACGRARPEHVRQPRREGQT